MDIPGLQNYVATLQQLAPVTAAELKDKGVVRANRELAAGVGALAAAVAADEARRRAADTDEEA
jgi:hypothetical protein